MYFKLEVILNRLFITMREEQPLTLAIPDKQNTTVLIRALNAEERQRHSPGSLMCTAVTQQEPPPDIHPVFVRLADNLMPEDFKPTKDQQDRKQIDATGRITEGYAVSLKLFPKQFQEFSSRVHHELNQSIRSVVKIMRWRMAVGSLHNPIASSRGGSFSFDNKSWHSSPRTVHVEIEGQPCPRVSRKVRSEIEALTGSDHNEPLGHELFLEAWELRSNNPRSALIIGLAAAEVGFKQCIGKLIPDAQWLANNIPTPPLDKMLSNYLPQLPTKLKIEGKVLKPSTRIRRAIKDGIQARNNAVHVGADAPKRSDLKEWLLSIRDLLYLLDFYCGYEWALDHIRDEVRAEMVTEFDLKSTKPFSVIDLG